MVDGFEEIRYYNDEEIATVARRLSRDRLLLSLFRKALFPRCPSTLNFLYDAFMRSYLGYKVRRIRTVDQFQREITFKIVVSWITRNTIKGLSFSGFDDLDKELNYLFIGNHRDITLDPLLLNQVLIQNGHRIASVAFGNNLLVNDLMSDLLRANKSFVVRRNLPRKERLEAAVQLSKYIRFLLENGESIWISQREGRAKNGDDRTDPAVIKMLYFSHRNGDMTLRQYLNHVRVVPVSISYEFDPCDILKAKEVSEGAGKIDKQKKQEMDFISIQQGAICYKGRVHISVGERIDGEAINVQEIAKKIDHAIQGLYKLWPTNYIAYDELMTSKEYASYYSLEEREGFLNRFTEEPPEIRRRALAMYAQAVINQRE